VICDPTIFIIARAEHDLRAREAQDWGEAQAAPRADWVSSPRPSFRCRTGAALVALDQRLQGTSPAPGAGGLRRLTG
jgi:hypothetical protein